MKKILFAIFLSLALQSAWAIDIGTAKSQGLIGEANSGYVAAVKKPASAEVSALVSSVNAKRKAEFTKTAKKTKTTVTQVSHRFYQLAVQKTKAGNYYQDDRGSWKKK